MTGLILGAVAGAFAAMYWHDDLKRMREKMGTDPAASVRDRVADMVDSVEASVGEGLRSWSKTLRGGTVGAHAEGAHTEGAQSSRAERPQSL